MARYPDSPRPNSGYEFRENWPTVVGGPEWAPQGRALTRFPLGEADLSYRAKTWDQIRSIADFFRSVQGAAGRFTFVDFNGIGQIGGADPGVVWSGLFVAKADGATSSWDAPTYKAVPGMFIGPTDAHVYENGVLKTCEIIPSSGSPNPAFDYHLQNSDSSDAGAGTDGVDLLTAEVVPAAGVIITIDAICRRAFRRARFTTVKFPLVLEVPAVYQTSGTLSIVEVRR